MAPRRRHYELRTGSWGDRIAREKAPAVVQVREEGSSVGGEAWGGGDFPEVSGQQLVGEALPRPPSGGPRLGSWWAPGLYTECVRPPGRSLSSLELNKVKYGRQAINRAKRAFSILLITAGPKCQVLYISE